ncbi:MAG: hypothetical protein R6V06_09005 [Kiritimatiellia bacterium]
MSTQKRSRLNNKYQKNKYQKVVLVNSPFVLTIMAVLLLSGVYIGFDQKNQSLERKNNILTRQVAELRKDYRRELANWNSLASENALTELLAQNNHGFDMIKEDQHPNVIYMAAEGGIKKLKSISSIARINRNQKIGVARSSY